MKITFAKQFNSERRLLQIDDAKFAWRPNFSGEEGQYNRKGERNFSIVIPNEEIANALMEDKNEFGVGWNVKIKPPREEGDRPFMYMNVKVKFNGRGPKIRLITNGHTNFLNEDTVGMLDHIDIARIDLDIRPYDDEFNGKPFRTAYLQEICVVQEVSRFDDRYAEEEYPGEVPFE